MPQPRRKIGDTEVSAQGLGCMGMSWAYSSFGGEFNGDEAMNVLTRAADLGINFWDTSDVYGPHTNEQLLGRWFAKTGRRKEIFLATKFANTVVNGERTIRGDAAYVKEACAASLERLGVDQIDLYYQHRVDPKTPIEETVGAMAELVKEGKVRYLGLSECSTDTLRRAYKIHPIAAAQMEYSPFATEIESEQTNFLAAARELGVKIVAYSPLGRGFLTNTIKSRKDFAPDDTRASHPRFSEEHFGANLKLVETLAGIAEKKGVTAGQLVLAWVMAQGEDFLPIPGTKRVKYLEENAKASEVHLSQEELREIRAEIEKAGGGKGERYPPAAFKHCFGDSPPLRK